MSKIRQGIAALGFAILFFAAAASDGGADLAPCAICAAIGVALMWVAIIPTVGRDKK